MQVSTIILLGLAAVIAVANANSVSSFARESEPRIFFRQVVEATGIFPVEVNVPDTIASMMSGMTYMYQTMSSYFAGGSEGGEQSQPSQDVVYDQVDFNTRPISGKHRKKKVKKLKAESEDDEVENLLDLFNFLMF